jgi:sulfoxide reductase heme-binding subunit YedZ
LAAVRRFLSGRTSKILVFALCLTPLSMLLWRAYNGNLTANPIEYVTRDTGTWTLRFLLLTLAVTPLRRMFKAPELIRFRRMLGLYAFFYGFLHLTTYVWFDKFFDAADIVKDIAKRPFITAGFTGFLLMLPLAVTSTSGWIRRLGGKRWQQLHRLVYFSTLAGVIHYYWLVKSDIRLPVFYGALLALAMLLRLPIWLSRVRSV